MAGMVTQELNDKERILRAIEPDRTKELREEIEEKKEQIENLDDEEYRDDDYDDYLDDCYGDIDVLGIPYSTSQILKHVDEIRYNMGKDEWEWERKDEKRKKLEAELEELEDELEDLKEE